MSTRVARVKSVKRKATGVPMSLRMTRQRVKRQMSEILAELPLEMFVMIFSFLDVESIIQCQLVSKQWYRAATEKSLWKGLIWDLPYMLLQCHNYLCYDENDRWHGRSLRKVVKPHEYHAQVTFRGLERDDFLRKHATSELLRRWWHNEQWWLIFQTLAPFLYYDSFIFSPPAELIPPNMNDQEPDEIRCFNGITMVMSTNQSRIKRRLENHWLKKRWDLTRIWGNDFMVKGDPETHQQVREPVYLVLHINDNVSDGPGIYLERRRYMDIAGKPRYSSKKLDDDFIYYGMKCMLDLHKAAQNSQKKPDYYNEENKALLAKVFSNDQGPDRAQGPFGNNL